MPCRAHTVPWPCRIPKGLDCVYPIWFTQCGHILFRHTMLCSDHAILKVTSQGQGAARQGHGMGTAWYVVWINMGCQETACERPAHVWLLPATMWTFTKVVNQTAAAFWDVFNCTDDDGDSRLYKIWTNLIVKATLSSVIILCLHCVFFFLGKTSLLCSDYIYTRRNEKMHAHSVTTSLLCANQLHVQPDDGYI